MSSSERKQQHLQLAERAQRAVQAPPEGYYYEPLLARHPASDAIFPVNFFQRSLNFPLWVSSMTGGHPQAQQVNERLARACRRFRLGMGLGSLRPMMEGRGRSAEFAMRPLIGDDLPLMGNVGLAQLQQYTRTGQLHQLNELVEELQLDGLFIHLNPLQEWFQPEGDRLEDPRPTLEASLPQLRGLLFVKEVGQGMGPQSLQGLLEMPLHGLELAGAGGTNFSVLEQLRAQGTPSAGDEELAQLGHTAAQMVKWLQELYNPRNAEKMVIISGGLRSYVEAYTLYDQCPFPSLVGMAYPFLKAAMAGEEELERWIRGFTRGWLMSHQVLHQRPVWD